MKKYIKILILLLLTVVGCVPTNEEIVVKEESNFGITFHKIENTTQITNTEVLQATIEIDNKYQFSTFGEIASNGFADNFNKAYIYDKEENIESIVLLDENKSPAFIYNVNLVSGNKLESLTEFEKLDDNQFYLRFYHYDWVNRIGTLLFETIIVRTGNEFTSNPTFETEYIDFNGNQVGKKLSKKNKSFGAPILRFDNTLKTASIFSSGNSNDLIDGWLNALDDFRNSEVVEFLNVAGATGLTAAALGASAVLLGAAAGAPLLIGGLGLAALSRVTQFFISDEFGNWVNEQRTSTENFVDSIGESGENLIEILEGYSTDLQSWLNENLSENDLESLLENIEEKEILSDNTLLDDLPTSEGVLQFALSWNTLGTDIDLYVSDPFDETISYRNSNSNSGGYLDRDDTDGLGPENIYWESNIPEGVYKVAVNYFGCGDLTTCPETSFTVKISNGLGLVNSFTGSLSTEGQTIQVVQFGFSASDIN